MVKPNWIVLKECGEELTKKGTIPFTRKQLIKCAQSKYSDRGESSLNPMIQGMTVNLKGGAPGATGKKVFVSVGRGLFKLYDEKDKTKIKAGTTSDESTSQQLQGYYSVRETGSTEDKVRNEIMKTLFYTIGEKGTWGGEGSSARFDLKKECGNVECCAEMPLIYKLPDGGNLSHKSDILMTDKIEDRFASIEIKHKSAVTDQFKCRSYDMLHYKNTYGSKILGIMIFVKATQGVSIAQAEKISYPFDLFFGIPSISRDNPGVWDELIKSIDNFFRNK